MRIDLFLTEPADLTVLRPIHDALNRRGHDVALVLEPPTIASDDQTTDRSSRATLPAADTYEDTRGALARVDLHATSRGRYISADAVVSIGAPGALSRYRCARIKAALEAPLQGEAESWRDVADGFDAVLVNGAFGRRLAQPSFAAADRDGRIFEVGHPALAAFRRRGVELDVRRCGNGLNPLRPTLLYLVAEGGEQLERFGDELMKLGRTHNVVLRPHPQLVRTAPERLVAMRRSPYVTVDMSPYSALPAILFADLVLVDATSERLAEVCLLDRRVIALRDQPARPDEGWIGGLHEAVPVLSEPSSLATLVQHLLHDDPYAAGRCRLAGRVYAALDDRDDSVAAEAIERVARHERSKSMPAATAIGNAANRESVAIVR